MPIELTPEQLQALDALGETPIRFIDPRTQTSYLLVPESTGPKGDADDESADVVRAFARASMRAMARRLKEDA